MTIFPIENSQRQPEPQASKKHRSSEEQQSKENLQPENPQPLGRYSFLMADPFETIEIPVGGHDALAQVDALLKQFQTATIPGLPPMQGGIAGLFSYDLNQSFDDVRPAKHDEFKVPAMVVGAYDTVVAWDHSLNRTWIISQGYPEKGIAARRSRANHRIKFFEDLVCSHSVNGDEPSQPAESDNSKNSVAANESETVSELTGQQSHKFPIDRLEGLSSNFSKSGYIAAVQKCIDYIYAGDVFQVNLAQQLLFQANCDSVELFCRLRSCNPAPFAGYFDLSQISKCDAQVVSASPERLCSVRDKVVETRPIKGTRKRTGRPMVDIQSREQLLASVKDRAENTMIVDLMRNDLSIVCESDSVLVTQLCELEEYQSVMHLVSSVRGRLAPEKDLVDLVAAVFPGGSITGAPKVRAMEIIAELEPTARGPYCGSLGYLGFDGSADLNILIRTITASQGWWQIPVGGGIVSQSDPQHEYEETWTKAASMLRAVTMGDS